MYLTASSRSEGQADRLLQRTPGMKCWWELLLLTPAEKRTWPQGLIFRFSRLLYWGMQQQKSRTLSVRKSLWLLHAGFDRLVPRRQRRLVKNASNLISLCWPVCFPKYKEGFQFIAYSTFQITCLAKQLWERERGTDLYLQQILPLQNVWPEQQLLSTVF